MLTTLFYYDYYKPYMIGGVTSNKNMPAQRIKRASAKQDVIDRTFNAPNGAVIERNMSVKAEVISYARNFSSGVTGIKDGAKSLINNADYIKFTAHSEGMDSAVEWLQEEVASFAGAFNKANDFAKNQEHSTAVSDFVDDVAGELLSNADSLAPAGLSFNANGSLLVNEGVFGEDISFARLSSLLEGLTETVGKVYKTATDFLTAPLSEHMGFRSLSYYYDYRLGGIAHNSMNIVSSGLIVDVSI